MLTSTPSVALTAKLNLPGAVLDTAAAIQIELTPPLALAAALLYMMLSNGQVEKAEIDQLQSVIGKNADLLRCAVDYVHGVPVDQFIDEVPTVLCETDQLCVLTNMCDAMLSDGQTDAAELDLLARLAAAFGLSDEDFQPYYEAIALKNDKTVLGSFDKAKLETQQATPHLAMAASLIYMMASDGSLGPEEIGRLQAMIGEFEGLQKVAVKYALKVKSEQFFTSAARFLNDDQKIFILTNVCDIMLADGVIEAAEKVVFQNMRNAFGYTEEEFEPFHTAISAKNLKTFDTDTFTYVRDRRLGDDSDSEDIFSGAGVSLGASSKSGGLSASNAQLGSAVSRAMRANIVKVSSDFGSAKKINRISINSTSEASAERDIPAIKFKAGAQDLPDDDFAGTSSRRPRQRLPLSFGGRDQTRDGEPSQDLHGQSQAGQNPDPDADSGPDSESDVSPSARRKTSRLPAFGARPAPTRRTRRPRFAKHDHHTKAKAAADLDQVRNRLKHSHVVNAVIRQQLDHYDATGQLVRLPMPLPHAAVQPAPVHLAATAIAIATPPLTPPSGAALTLVPALPVWRIAIPVALLASALMGGTALMASLAAPQAASAGAEERVSQVKLDLHRIDPVLIKQS